MCLEKKEISYVKSQSENSMNNIYITLVAMSFLQGFQQVGILIVFRYNWKTVTTYFRYTRKRNYHDKQLTSHDKKGYLFCWFFSGFSGT